MKKTDGRGNPALALQVKAYWKFKRENPDTKLTMREFFAGLKNVENLANTKNSKNTETLDDKNVEALPVAPEVKPDANTRESVATVKEVPFKCYCTEKYYCRHCKKAKRDFAGLRENSFSNKFFKKQKWSDPEDRRFV